MWPRFHPKQGQLAGTPSICPCWENVEPVFPWAEAGEDKAATLSTEGARIPQEKAGGFVLGRRLEAQRGTRIGLCGRGEGAFCPSRPREGDEDGGVGGGDKGLGST